MRSAGAFYSSRYSLLSYRPKVFDRDDVVTPVMISLSAWCKQNNYSKNQARRLIREKSLLAKKYKNQWYVYLCKEADDL